MQEITGMPTNSFWGGKYRPKVVPAIRDMAPAMCVDEREMGNVAVEVSRRWSTSWPTIWLAPWWTP